MRRASVPDLPGNACKLAYLIAFRHMDCKTQSVWAVSQETLAAGLNVKIRTVQNLLGILVERCGLKIEVGRGSGKTSTYQIPIEFEVEKAKSSFAFRDAKRRIRKRRIQTTKKGESRFAPS